MPLSVCIITRNEEDNLPRCLQSVAGLAEQVVVVDSLSTDRTAELARAAGAEVHEQEFLGHVRQKQLALDQARCDWVLCLDADEWLDERLRAAVADIVRGDGSGCAGFELDRRTFYLGAWIDHCGWSPEWRLRLVRRGQAQWAGRDPHDRLEARGPTGRLAGRLCHRPYRSLSEHLSKIERYTDTIARDRFAAGESASVMALLLRPGARFLRMFLLQGGFLDGWRGLVVSSLGGWYVFLKHAKLLELHRAGQGP